MNSAPTPTERRLQYCAWIALAALLALLAWQCRDGWPVSSDLLELAPQTAQDDLRRRAQQRVDAPLAQRLVVLVGHEERQRAVALARTAAGQLEGSGEFTGVQLEIGVDVPALRAQLLAARLAMLPAPERARLAGDPAVYAAQRAAELVDPFASAGILPLQDDFLGLGGRIEHALQPTGALRVDLASNTLQADGDGRHWVLIVAQARGDGFDHQASARVAAAVDAARAAVTGDGGRLLAAAGALYAAAGSTQARLESTRIGALSLAGTVLVLLLALRRPRTLVAFLPVGAGLAAGTAACVAVFGHIHVFTLVTGASLLGIAIDFPMHWLGKAYGLPDWQAWSAMRQVRPGLTISLATTLVGYLALLFTPFPALTQTAVFSAAGLAAAYACTLLLLPALFGRWRPQPWPGLAQGAARLLATVERTRRLAWPQRLALALVAAALCAAGIARLNLHDDMRQWLGVPPALVDDAQAIGTITGIMPTSQFFLVRAPDADALLRRQAELAARLDPLVAQGRLRGYDALSQAAAPAETQTRLRTHLAALADTPAVWQPLAAVGVPPAALQAELRALAALPVLPLPQVLDSPLAERWRSLWLGQIDGQAVGLVTLQGLASADGLAALADGLPGVELVDRSGELNVLFGATRLEAAELKLASYAVATLLLWQMLGRAAVWRILAVPLAATLCTLAVLGYAGQPVTLFALFGLLLVSALGVDYAIFMYEGVGGAPACLIGIGLGAVTTLLSFGLLAASATPAIASFGLAVAVGVLFSVLFAAWMPARTAPDSSLVTRTTCIERPYIHGNP
ncbi:MMPL family transporter [Pseudothauera rhizosphaerae]|uniref:MMPL family transporter n=1 Tax=Pseudothauera rhizosphaerae TaxID=2565932 RepID=UPI001B3B1D33|nr:hypothetical protein [Pseudothauera rhizosphaerae]